MKIQNKTVFLFKNTVFTKRHAILQDTVYCVTLYLESFSPLLIVFLF